MSAAQRPFGISVVIPTFNRVDTLRRAIDSVRTARPREVEIVVVDDGSPEDPRPLLPAFNNSGVPVRAYRLERNRGPQSARNLGIRRAAYSHVAFLDSDDAFTPEKVDAVLAELHAQPQDILFHAVGGMTKCNRLGTLWTRHARRWLPFHWWAVLYNPAATPGLVVKRRVRLGRPGMRHSEDWFFVLHYARPGMRVKYLDRELSQVFRAQGSAGGLSASTWRMRRGEFAARAALLKRARPMDGVRYALGTLVGLCRMANDLLRGRYWR